mmetsp:Transcript_7368/g.17279  ORF Transcript_7368/g.17279 Transcript_7368/m.17279 type:complete len:212 (-) Transcript_7368:363-998(-)
MTARVHRQEPHACRDRGFPCRAPEAGTRGQRHPPPVLVRGRSLRAVAEAWRARWGGHARRQAAHLRRADGRPLPGGDAEAGAERGGGAAGAHGPLPRTGRLGRHRLRSGGGCAVPAGRVAAAAAVGGPLRQAGGVHERAQPAAFRAARVRLGARHRARGRGRGRARRRRGRGLPRHRRAGGGRVARLRRDDPRRGHPVHPTLRALRARHRR